MMVGCGVDNTSNTNSNDVNNENNNTSLQQDNNSNNDVDNNVNNNMNDEEEEGEEGEEASVLDEADPSIIKLVNKENELGPDDHPDDLVTIDVPYVLDNPEVNQLRK